MNSIVDLTAGEEQLAMALEASLAIAAEQFSATPSDVRWVDVRLLTERRDVEFQAALARHAEQLTVRAGRKNGMTRLKARR